MLTKEQTAFLLGLLNNSQIGGGLLDLAFATKQSLLALAAELELEKRQAKSS